MKTEVLLGARREIAHPDPERAARLAIVTANAVCRDLLIVKPPPPAGSVELEGEDLAREIPPMLLRWLT